MGIGDDLSGVSCVKQCLAVKINSGEIKLPVHLDLLVPGVNIATVERNKWSTFPALEK
jgi:hypothetical protein